MDDDDRTEEMARVETRAADLRHELRNRFAAVRNAAFYLRRKVETTALWEEDPRVARFFELIETELTSADDSLRAQMTAARLLRPADDETDGQR